MVNEFVLNIVNNTPFILDYVVIVNGQRYSGVKNNISTEYHVAIDQEYAKINITKINNWICHKNFDKFLMYLSSLDIKFCISESINLPISINYTIDVPLDKITDVYKIQLSDIIETTKESVSTWKKGAFIQYATVFLAIFIASSILCLTCPMPFKIPLVILISLGVYFLARKVVALHKKIMKDLSAIKVA